MTIIIYLSKQALSVYAINALHAFKSTSDLSTSTFVGIIGEEALRQSSTQTRSLFDRIHQAKLDKHQNSLIQFNYDAIKNIIQEEKDTHTDANIYILGVDEIDLLNVGRLRREFNLYGLNDIALLPFRDKAEMKSHLQKAQIPFPKSLLFSVKDYQHNKQSYYNKIIEEIGTPFILKPSQSAASVGIQKIQSENDFESFSQDCQSHPQYMIEAFIEGTQYHCESIIQEGEFIFEACAQYIYPPIEMILEGHILGSYPLRPTSQKFKEIIAFNRRVLSSLGRPNITSTLELYEHPKTGFIFIELNGRLPGEPMNYVYYKQFGIWMSSLDFKLQTHQALSPVALNTITNTCWVYIPRINGTIQALNPPKLNSNYSINWQVQKGDTILSSRSVNDKAASLILENEDDEALQKDIKTLKSFTFIEVNQ